ncbi:hypothetical protein [Tenacibaculum ovolyticum]|uniref:hypothetical protein n=1 Tax=Tenacibaculum ovolyticum TaxID=104270 RepID=UPI001F300F1D|nr:hypothetical protein [Tenacibaculum ovolyticum]
MMKRILILFAVCVFFSCKEDNKRQNKSTIENNRFIDNFFLDNRSEKVYELGTKFKYSFKFTPANSKRRHSINYKDLKDVDFISVRVVNYNNKDNVKLALKYSYPPNGISASSLLIENDSIVWIHPPRRHFLKILELNPFPYIKKKEIGYQWNDSLFIGSQYADKRWAVWQKNLINKSKYEIVKDTFIDTSFGVLKCKKVYASSQNKIGKTTLTSFL